MILDDELIDCGRTLGNQLIEGAREVAQTTEELRDGLIVLQVAALHILALMAFNKVKQDGKAQGTTLIKGFNDQIIKDVAWFQEELEKGNMTRSTVGSDGRH